MIIRITATVNGQERAVDMDGSDLPGWALAWTDGVTQGGIPDVEDLDAIESHLMNIEPYYWQFYEGATSDDIDATLTDITVSVVQA